jgi:hypothetical protein
VATSHFCSFVSSIDSAFYSGGPAFKYRPGNWLYSLMLFLIFLSCATLASFHNISVLLGWFNTHLNIWRYGKGLSQYKLSVTSPFLLWPQNFLVGEIFKRKLRISQLYDSIMGRVMAQVVSRRPLTAEAWVRARVNLCWICCGQSGTGTGFSPSSSVSPCQYHSTLALQTYVIGGTRNMLT